MFGRHKKRETTQQHQCEYVAERFWLKVNIHRIQSTAIPMRPPAVVFTDGKYHVPRAAIVADCHLLAGGAYLTSTFYAGSSDSE